MHLPRRKLRSQAVLLLGREWAEWYGPGPNGPVRGRSEVRGERPDDLARAAAGAMAASGGRARRCVLALAGGMVKSRSISLPILSRAELRKVFPRKAAALLESEPRHALYAALPLGSGDGEGQKWLLVAQHRKSSLELLLALRKHGIRAERVVVAHLARLCRAQELRGDTREACAVVDVGEQSVVASLIAGESLVHQSEIQGSFEHTPSLGVSVLQEVRGLDAFWRRTQRGGRVTQVVVLGLDPERGRHFANAASSALPEAVLTLRPDAGDCAGDARLETLAACRSRGPFEVDLSVHVPAPYSYLATLAASLLVVTVGLGSVLRERFVRTLEGLDERTRFLSFQARDLEQIADENQLARQAVVDLDAERERLLVAGSIGIPLEACLRDALAAFGDGAGLVALSMGRASEGGEVTISGVVDPHPVRLIQELERIGAALEESPRFAGVSVEPPGLAAGSDPRSGSVAFVVRAWSEEAP